MRGESCLCDRSQTEYKQPDLSPPPPSPPIRLSETVILSDIKAAASRWENLTQQILFRLFQSPRRRRRQRRRTPQTHWRLQLLAAFVLHRGSSTASRTSDTMQLIWEGGQCMLMKVSSLRKPCQGPYTLGIRRSNANKHKKFKFYHFLPVHT